jgi:hypothetical protein
VGFNFDNCANNVYLSTNSPSYDTTTVSWWTGFEWHSYDVFFNPAIFGGDPTIVLNMGTTPDRITIYGNANAVLVQGRSLHEIVNIGNWIPTLQDVRNTVTVTNPPYYTDLTIDDRGDSASKSATLTNSSLTGLTPKAINFNQGDLASLKILGGTGNNNTFMVADTPWSYYSGGLKTTLKNSSGSDTFTVQKTTGSLVIDGGSGTNSLVGPNANNTVWQIDQNGNGKLSAPVLGSPVEFSKVQNLKGGGGTNTLFGPPNAYTDWSIYGPDQGALKAFMFPSPVQFSAIQNLTGGAAGNTFGFFPGGSLSGSITGGGSDTLDYSFFNNTVVVDLPLNFATGVGVGVSGIQNVTGANNGPAGAYNLLIGAGGGFGVLTGGTGLRNILVAGGSPAALLGGNQDDLLIAGSTVYDLGGLGSWLQIANYWASSPDPFGTRALNLRIGNGVPLLDNTTVTSNGGSNFLFGMNELALLYIASNDNPFNFDPGSWPWRFPI